MVLTKPRKGNSTECHYWGYSFDWTDLHRSENELRPMIQTCDSLADECVQQLNKIPADDGSENKPFKKDLYNLLQDHIDKDPKYQELWEQINTVPEWVDWPQIQRGQDVFFRYGLPILNVVSDHPRREILHGGPPNAELNISLAKLRELTRRNVRIHPSLEELVTVYKLIISRGAMRVVETLARTGGFGVKVVRRRLLETLQHILQVHSSVDGMKPGGEGNISSVRVRLLHSSVRLKILSLVEQKPDYYDIDRYGIPANDLDCIGTINTFCSSVVWLGLPRQGIILTKQEIEDYIALWRLVAYYMGTPTEPFENTAKARAMMESLLISEIDPTDIGKILAKNIILGLENTAPAYASKEFMEAMSRLLNGEQLADELGIPRSTVYYRLLIWGYCFWVMGVSYIIPRIPFLDRTMIALRRKYFYKMILDEKMGLGGESRFDFKYVPTLNRTTRLGQRRTTKFERPGVESLARLGLLVALSTVISLAMGLIFVVRVLASNPLFHAIRTPQ